MVDVVNPETRSRMMSGIRGANTKPELKVRRRLHAAGFRYGLHRKDLPGRPDLVMPRYDAVIFVHGCYWHRHPGCRLASTPSTRTDFWTAKFTANQERDRRNIADLRVRGWRVAIVWECEVRTATDADEAVSKLIAWLLSDRDQIEIPQAARS
ncbi:very short patch repair endonuclease [Novosphingobium aquimarinum]|uniref:very short patch repair endonuclease n=1 Tax=Novosphingobium aquimarinum TaxID=2682494 RepID=UPI0012EB82FD|nr:DNA mismatch endonuclease Vsr [Novosphingobium aquimarinum]